MRCRRRRLRPGVGRGATWPPPPPSRTRRPVPRIGTGITAGHGRSRMVEGRGGTCGRVRERPGARSREGRRALLLRSARGGFGARAPWSVRQSDSALERCKRFQSFSSSVSFIRRSACGGFGAHAGEGGGVGGGVGGCLMDKRTRRWRETGGRADGGRCIDGRTDGRTGRHRQCVTKDTELEKL